MVMASVFIAFGPNTQRLYSGRQIQRQGTDCRTRADPFLDFGKDAGCRVGRAQRAAMKSSKKLDVSSVSANGVSFKLAVLLSSRASDRDENGHKKSPVGVPTGLRVIQHFREKPSFSDAVWHSPADPGPQWQAAPASPARAHRLAQRPTKQHSLPTDRIPGRTGKESLPSQAGRATPR